MNKKIRFNFIIIFLSLNFIFSLIISSFYIFLSNHSFIEFVFLVFAVLSNTIMIYVPLMLVSLLAIFLPLHFLIIIFSFFHLLLVIDFIIYKFWDFHINSMVINLIMTPGGMESLNQSWNVKAVFIGICLFLILIEIFVYYLAKKANRSSKFFFRFVKKMVYLIIVALFVDKFGFAISSLYDFTPIVKNRDLLPLYQPLSIRSFANKYLGFNLEKIYENIDMSNTNFDYPKKEIKFTVPNKQYNIVMLIIDSMRYDMFDKEIMPYTWDFSKKASVFLNHYSGGNCSRFGIFSIMYGLYGNYWFNALSNRKGPVLIDVLKKQGYDMRILSSSKLSFPEFDKTCFINVEREKIFDKPVKGNGAVRDIETTDNAVSYMKSEAKTKPYFMFVFYDAAHGSFDYTIEFEKFKPSYGVNLLTLNKDNVLPLFNKYKNSIHFNDSLISRIINSIKESGDLKNTIIIITGDHGEAFFERGYSGHNHSYSKEEVLVPLIFYHPDLKPKVINYKTSHFDIVPTLLNIMGIKNEFSDYSHGYDLFKENKRVYMPAFSWDDSGIIFDDYTIVVPISSYGGRLKFYRNLDWREVDKKNDLMSFVIDFRKDLTRFFKK